MLELSRQQILELHEAAISAGLATGRAGLLSGISKKLVATLPVVASSSEQILLDLSALNGLKLDDGTAPLVVWLESAISTAGGRAETAVFKRALRCLHSPIPGNAHPQAAYIAEKTEGFVGRDHIFSAIESFLGQHRKGYFTIEGEPGIGKTSLLAEYVRRFECPAHFNIWESGTRHAAQFLSSISAQLSVRFGVALDVDPATVAGSQPLANLLEACARQLQVGEKLVLAVDALDEVDLGGQPAGVNVLYLPRNLPEHVYVLVTRRPTFLPWVVESEKKLNLQAFDERNRADIRLSLQREVLRPGVTRWLEEMSLDAKEVVDVLADKSEGNFMYLHYVLSEIENQGYRDRQLVDLPRGLVGYYEDHWSRMGMSGPGAPRKRIQIIYVLAQSKKPVMRKLLAETVQADEIEVQQALDEWRQFLRKEEAPGGTSTHSIYHASFRDFLFRKDIVQAAGESVASISRLRLGPFEGLLAKFLR